MGDKINFVPNEAEANGLLQDVMTILENSDCYVSSLHTLDGQMYQVSRNGSCVGIRCIQTYTQTQFGFAPSVGYNIRIFKDGLHINCLWANDNLKKLVYYMVTEKYTEYKERKEAEIQKEALNKLRNSLLDMGAQIEEWYYGK